MQNGMNLPDGLVMGKWYIFNFQAYLRDECDFIFSRKSSSHRAISERERQKTRGKDRNKVTVPFVIYRSSACTPSIIRSRIGGT